MSEFDQATTLHIARLCSALELLRLHDTEMTLQLAQTFLYVAAHEHCQKNEMERALSLTPPSGSRNTLRLSDGKKQGTKEPLGLVRRYISDDDLRVRKLCLTPKGRSLIRCIDKQLRLPH